MPRVGGTCWLVKNKEGLLNLRSITFNVIYVSNCTARSFTFSRLAGTWYALSTPFKLLTFSLTMSELAGPSKGWVVRCHSRLHCGASRALLFMHIWWFVKKKTPFLGMWPRTLGVWWSSPICSMHNVKFDSISSIATLQVKISIWSVAALPDSRKFGTLPCQIVPPRVLLGLVMYFPP